jgi:hypothetical protein
MIFGGENKLALPNGDEGTEFSNIIYVNIDGFTPIRLYS